jgi:hypothetical protein
MICLLPEGVELDYSEVAVKVYTKKNVLLCLLVHKTCRTLFKKKL